MKPTTTTTLYLLAGFLCACSGAQSTTANAPVKPFPDAIVIRVDTVTVSANRPETSEPWDPPTEDRKDGGCDLVSELGKLLHPVVGLAAQFMCTNAPQPTAGRDNTLPDLAVSLSATGMLNPYRSFVAPNQISRIFNYGFLVPTQAIPADGLVLQVLDNDVTERDDELIGSVRLFREQLLTALNTPNHTLRFKALGTGLELLELVVLSFQSVAPSHVSMDAKRGTVAVNLPRHLFAGEVVDIRAQGLYQIGSWNNAPLTPLGYPEGGPKEYNFKGEPFESAPHGAGIALVAAEGLSRGYLVTPCSHFVSSLAGTLKVGINDDSPTNNQGSVTFTVRTRQSTANEWLNPQDSTQCLFAP
jgi:hypothetical protein